ncbi:hypothetical protein NLG97_g7238 [Lecanicillium saksenae]|uniref:Uncharacterized protein n=1 Tax=Lecanicillium saksenae TaxID=468837 RepID=A0ACC1QP20_9HYPO|nr:hypothetical protein NLG97_g7238 [Lecanicillium saksenae]
MRGLHFMSVVGAVLAISSGCLGRTIISARGQCTIECPGKDDVLLGVKDHSSGEPDPEWAEIVIHECNWLFDEQREDSWNFKSMISDFKSLIWGDEDDEKFDCVEDTWATNSECTANCDPGTCMQTFEGDYVCSSCFEYRDKSHRMWEGELVQSFKRGLMMHWMPYDGQFHVTADGLTANPTNKGLALMYFYKVADFVFDADIMPMHMNTTGQYGLVFRATAGREARGDRGGYYYAGIDNPTGQVFLKHMPSGTQLSSADVELRAGERVHIKVQAVEDVLSVFVNDMATPKFVKRDLALGAGFNGVRVDDTGATFGNITVRTVKGSLGGL